MIPSRGLRWSSQAIGIGRRRLEVSSSRQFSSSIVQHGPIRANPLLSKNTASIPRAYPRSQFLPINILVRNSAGVRYASSTPTTPAAPITNATTSTTEAASSATSSSSNYITSLDSATDFSTSFDSATDFTTESLYNIPEHIGYLKSLGLDYGWGPTAGVEWLLEHVHVLAGTPWWISIALTTLLIRVVLFKPYVDAAENASKMMKIIPMTKPITARMTAAQKAGDMDGMMRARGELQAINKRAGIKMWKSFIPLLNAFTGFGTFILLRGMAKLPVPGLESGGVLWFYNLTLPDPYFLLPIGTAALLYNLLRRGGELGTSTLTPGMQKAFMWGMPALTLIFTWWQPAALTFSFFVTGCLSYGQATLFRQDWFRRYFNMTSLPPKAPVPGEQPPSPYQGKLKIAANPVLSQAELSSRFQGAGNTDLQQKIGQIKDNSPPGGVVGEFLSKKIKDVKTSIADVSGTAKGVVGQAREQFGGTQDKAAKKAADQYESRRQKEMKMEELQRQNERRAMRAAKKQQR